VTSWAVKGDLLLTGANVLTLDVKPARRSHGWAVPEKVCVLKSSFGRPLIPQEH
jgi:hypothetical protein